MRLLRFGGRRLHQTEFWKQTGQHELQKWIENILKRENANMTKAAFKQNPQGSLEDKEDMA